MKNVPLRCRMPFRMKLMVHFPVRNFIIWLAPPAGKMNQIARRDWLLERARWSHLSRSGLPAVSRKKNFPESHIINPLLTKLFGQDGWTLASFFFCEFMDLNFVSVHKHAKQNLANIQPALPHTWSITHMNYSVIYTVTLSVPSNVPCHWFGTLYPVFTYIVAFPCIVQDLRPMVARRYERAVILSNISVLLSSGCFP